jgi:hypothetical protein
VEGRGGGQPFGASLCSVCLLCGTHVCIVLHVCIVHVCIVLLQQCRLNRQTCTCIVGCVSQGGGVFSAALLF